MTYTLLIFLSAMICFDAWVTLKILKSGGRELNPLVRKAMEKFGNTRGLIIVKLPTVIIAAFLPWLVLLVLCLFYGIVVCANAEVYFNQQRGK